MKDTVRKTWEISVTMITLKIRDSTKKRLKNRMAARTSVALQKNKLL